MARPEPGQTDLCRCLRQGKNTARMTTGFPEEPVADSRMTLTDSLKMIVCVAALSVAESAYVSDIDSAFVDNASALVAIQLSSEVGSNLSAELMRKGMSKVEADALVFRVVDSAARCAVRRLKEHDLPQVVSFVDMLASNEEMSAVTGALDQMYSREQLDAMQSEVSSAVRACLELSMRIPQTTTGNTDAVG